MNRVRKRITAGFLAGAMALSMFMISGNRADRVEAAGIPVRETTVTEAGEGKILIGLEGLELTSAQADIIEEINRVRWEACNPKTEADMVPDPRDKTRMLTSDDYVPIQLGVNCQKAAVIRAAEASVLMDHMRPNGARCSTVGSYFGVSCAENLAWDFLSKTAMGGWIDEKDDWVNQVPGAMVGHYTTMINPNNKYVGIATFNPSNDSILYGSSRPDWDCTSGEFSMSDEPVPASDYATAQNHTVIQKIEVPVSNVTGMDIVGDTLINVGTDAKISLQADVTFTKAEGSVAESVTSGCPVYDHVKWESSEESVISVDADGTLHALDTGEVEITATIGSGSSQKSVSRKILAVPAGVTVTGVEDPETVYTESTVAPTLSKTVKALLSNGSSVDVDVTWGTYSSSDLLTHYTSKEFSVTGTALGQTVTQKVHVNPAVIKRIFPEVFDGVDASGKNKYKEIATLTVESGEMPETIYTGVSLSNGYTWTYPSSWTVKQYVTWDKATLDQYKNRLGGDFTINGTIALDSDNGKVDYPVSVPLHVNPAVVTNVQMEDAEVTTASGTAPEYPKATVTWSNTDVTSEDITWADAEPSEGSRKYMAREGGNYVLTGTYGSKSCQLTVHVEPAYPVGASLSEQEKTKTVNCGTKAELAEKATVTWSNGDETEESITWEEQVPEEYSRIEGNTYVVTGTAKGKEVKTTVHVNPATIESVEALSKVQTVERVAPVIPATVKVTWSNGEVTNETVEWDAITAGQYAEPNKEFTVSGRVYDFEQNKTTITVVVHVNPRAVSGIAWKTGSPKTDTSYYAYDKADLTGTIVVTYDNGDTAEVDLTSSMITTFDPDSQSSSQTVTITYTEAGVSKTLTATMKLIRRIGIRIDSEPQIKKYIEEEEFDPTGISLVELLDNNTERAISEDEQKTAVYSGYDMTPESYGDQTVTVTVGTFSDTFTINVRKKTIQKLRIVNFPSKMNYVTTQPLDMTGLKVNLVYDNKTEKQISVTTDMIRENVVFGDEDIDTGVPANTDTAGKHKIDILYSEKEEEDGKEYTTYLMISFEITVEEKVVQSIEFKTAPSRTSFPEGDVTFNDFSDATLLVHNNNDYDEIVSISEAVISGFDIDQIGIQTVTVSYGGKSMTFEATVRQKQVTGVYSVAPTRISYTEGEVMDLTGGEAVICYDNGTDEHVAFTSGSTRLSFSFDDGFDLSQAMTEAKRNLVVKWDDEEILQKNGKKIEIDVIRKMLKKLQWKTGSPTNDKSYYNYDKKDLTGTLIATYDNGDTEEVELTPSMITTFDPDSQSSSQTVTITYSYAGVSVTMDAVMKLVKRAGIRVTTLPDKTVYTEGNALDISGIGISEVMDNKEVRPLSEEEAKTAVVTGYESRPKTYGEQTVTVTVGEFSAGFKVTVKKRVLTGLELLENPEQLTYVEGQPINTNGIKVQAHYNNGDEEEIRVGSDMLREGVKIGASTVDEGTPASTKEIGTHTIDVLYSEEDAASGKKVVGYVSFDIEVIKKEVLEISFVKAPTRTSYPELYTKFDYFGYPLIYAKCNNGYTEKVKVTKAMISGFSLSKVGTQTVTITYGGKKLTFRATVTKKKIKSLVMTAPKKTVYEEGQKLALTGSKITVTYNNGRKATYALSLKNKNMKIWFAGGISASAKLTPGKKTLYVTFQGKTAKLKNGTRVVIRVNKKPVKYSNEWVKGLWYNKDGSQTYKYKLSWKHNSKGWWVEDTSGWYPKNQKQKIDGKWYSFDAKGYMK